MAVLRPVLAADLAAGRPPAGRRSGRAGVHIRVRLALPDRAEEVDEVARLDSLAGRSGDVRRFDAALDCSVGAWSTRRLRRAAAEPGADAAGLVARADMDMRHERRPFEVPVRQLEVDPGRADDLGTE